MIRTHTRISNTQAYNAMLESAATLQALINLGVERGFTLYPEWGLAFTHLDKRIENRPNPPPTKLVGKRIAFHNGAHVGGRKGRKGGKAHQEGLCAVTETAKAMGWEIRLIAGERGRGPLVEFHKGDKVVRLDAVGADHPRSPGVIGIVRSAITFTAVIAGFEPPTDTPKYPWQFASDPEDSESWSYGWHVTDVIALRTPIPCAGLQGPWTLAGAIEREAKRRVAR